MVSFVENKLKSVGEINAKRAAYTHNIKNQIDDLQDKLWEMPADMNKTVADSVLEDLHYISINGNDGNTYKAFDDADIKWYLTEYSIDAPAHNSLKQSYNKIIDTIINDTSGRCLMYNWRPSTQDAKDLLAEINEYMGKANG